MTRFSKQRRLLLLGCILCIVGCTLVLFSISQVQYFKVEKSSNAQPANHILLPSCHPHHRVKSTTQSIKRIYFYHVRKAGGTMIRNYLQKVAEQYDIHLQVDEYNHASSKEEVGSKPDTLYITNLRDPVERSISHFKYSERWDCEQLVHNESFIPTQLNARPFSSWNGTKGFESSPCDLEFSFTQCAVNCYLQTFSGMGCTNNEWFKQYNMAFDRLRKYNLILIYERFKDPKYIHAVEDYFGGIQGFNTPAHMFCGDESKEANDKVPLSVSEFAHVFKLQSLNKMDERLYNDFLLSCGWNKINEEEIEYDFPILDSNRFVAQLNRTVNE